MVVVLSRDPSSVWFLSDPSAQVSHRDLIVKLIDGSGHEVAKFAVHKFVLAALSPLLREMLSDIDSFDDVYICMEEDSETVQFLFELLYSGQVRNCNINEYFSLAQLLGVLKINWLDRVTYDEIVRLGVDSISDLRRDIINGGKADADPSSRSDSDLLSDHVIEQTSDIVETYEIVPSFNELSFERKTSVPGETNQGEPSLQSDNEQRKQPTAEKPVCNSNAEKPNAASTSTIKSGAFRTSKQRGTLPNNCRSFACQFCSYTSRRKDNLAVHTRTHTGEKPYACSHCSQSFIQWSHLSAHLKVKHSTQSKMSGQDRGRSFACQFCSYTSCRKDNLAVHTRTHTGEKPYACSRCSQSFNQRSNLGAHLKCKHSTQPKRSRQKAAIVTSRVRGPEELVATTTADGEQTARTVTLSDGRNSEAFTHSPAKGSRRPAVPKTCHTRESKTSRLSVKSNTITKPGKTIYKCDVCSYTTTWLWNKIIHMRTHTGEKPYACGECPFSASQGHSLKSHLFYKHGRHDSAHQCTICKRKFPFANLLKKHTNERHFLSKCDRCPFSCINKTLFRKHVRCHGSSGKFKCSSCCYARNKMSFVLRHEKLHEQHFENPQQLLSIKTEDLLT